MRQTRRDPQCAPQERNSKINIGQKPSRVTDRSDIEVLSNPEFLREGSAVSDFLYPDRIVVGVSTDRAAKIMREVYQPLLDASYAERAGAVPKPEAACEQPLYIETSPQSAELVKHACNAFLAMKVSFINAVANVCEAVGADIGEVSKGVGSDRRIGSHFLNAGIGYGGSCFPKDVAAFRSAALKLGYPFGLLDEVHKINQHQRVRFLRKVRMALWTLSGKKLGVLGLAFKDGTDDIRESPSVQIVQALIAEGCEIAVFDPAAMSNAKNILGDSMRYAPDAYAAAEGADALLILTEWREFTSLDLPRIKELLKYPISQSLLAGGDGQGRPRLSLHGTYCCSNIPSRTLARASNRVAVGASGVPIVPEAPASIAEYNQLVQQAFQMLLLTAAIKCPSAASS